MVCLYLLLVCIHGSLEGKAPSFVARLNYPSYYYQQNLWVGVLDKDGVKSEIPWRIVITKFTADYIL